MHDHLTTRSATELSKQDAARANPTESPQKALPDPVSPAWDFDLISPEARSAHVLAALSSPATHRPSSTNVSFPVHPTPAGVMSSGRGQALPAELVRPSRSGVDIAEGMGTVKTAHNLMNKTQSALRSDSSDMGTVRFTRAEAELHAAGDRVRFTIRAGIIIFTSPTLCVRNKNVYVLGLLTRCMCLIVVTSVERSVNCCERRLKLALGKYQTPAQFVFKRITQAHS